MKLILTETQYDKFMTRVMNNFDEFVGEQEFVSAQLRSMIKERKNELDKLIQRLRREELSIPKINVSVLDKHGFAELTYYNPDKNKNEKRNFDLGNVNWFDDEKGLNDWAKAKAFTFLNKSFPNTYY
jgi:hypothetical protein